LPAENNTGIDDRQRRRNFLTFSGSLGFITLLVFMVFDYQEGNLSEIFLDVFMCTVIVSGGVAVFKYNLDRLAYCVGINLVSLTLLYDVAIGAGGTGGLFWLPTMPLFIFFFLERTESVISAILFYGCATILLMFPAWLNTFPYDVSVGSRYLNALFFIVIIAYGLESSRHRSARLLKQSYDELKSHKEKLEQALSEVKTLSGLLPICANCKKVRDDKGYWNQIESYVREHSEAEFSHGICPSCARELYPDVDFSDLNPSKNVK